MKNSERLLLALLVGILFCGANIFTYKWYARSQEKLALEEAQLRADRAEGEVALQKQALWAQRQAWVHDHQPVVGNSGDAGAQVLEAVLKGARDHKLEIIEQSLADPAHTAGGLQINVALKVKGSMENLARWLAQLQQPGDFYGVMLLSMKADQDQKSMIGSLQIARLFQEKK